MKRRNFIASSAGALGALAIGCKPSAAAGASQRDDEFEAMPPVPAAIWALTPLTPPPVPITDTEREARIEKARRLMADHHLDAIFMEGGTSLYYYTGVHWGLSERTFGLVIPRKGEIAWVTPAFEEARAKELIKFGTDIRTWQEDESPFALVAGILRDRSIATGRIGMEERVRFFVADGVHLEAPQLGVTSATPVTAGCRMIKSPAEIALMQHANDITITAYKAAWQTLREGMSQDELARNIVAAFHQLGADGDVSVQYGKYTAFPHGSATPQHLKEGDVVMIDDGVRVEGYTSDITRTGVFGKPTQRQRDIWELERKAQDAGFAAAQIGVPCEDVDAAARKVITDAGFGPGYKVPGLPHRTGHGIGLDGHEWTYFVKGNRTPIQPGMCFSDEPTIAIYGEFGIRLEDCLHMTEQGPRFFTAQAPSIDQLFV
ncbi:MAG TPA: Xaa-Pro peptidase family protein [Gemmatimonadaceae bacterium]|nr:Xaa-Pro peptidase family protein [Gemmatimonadaceae bacterium]